MTEILMEPLVIRGDPRWVRQTAAPSVVDGEPLVVRARPSRLTNRAAGLLRAGGDPRFGGFAYARTSQDDREAAAAARRALAGPQPSDPEPSGPVSGRAGGEQARSAGAGTLAAPATGTAGAQPTEDLPVADVTDAAPAEPSEAAQLRGPASGAPPAGAPPAGPQPRPSPLTEAATDAGPAGSPLAGRSPPAGLATPADIVSAARSAAATMPSPAAPRATLDQTLAPIVTTARGPSAQSARGGGAGGRLPTRPVEPIEVDPVPRATEALSTALNARLPNLSLPAPKPMPDGTVPSVAPVQGLREGELDVEVTVDAPAADAARVNRREEERRATAARPVTPEATESPPIPVSPPVLVDVRSLPPPPLPPAQAALETTQVTRVLAIVSAGVDGSARDFVAEVRRRAFPPDRMGAALPQLTDPYASEATTKLTAKVAELREAASIAEEALQAAVATRRAELDARVAHVATAAELQVNEASATMNAAAARENARIETRRRREQARIVARRRAALHSRDPTLVEELVIARLGYIDTDVGRGTVAVDTAKTRRLGLVGRFDAAYREAYRAADGAFQHPSDGRTRSPPNLPDGRLWIDVARDELTTAVAALRTQTDTDAAALTTTLRAAGDAAKAAVRAWSDTRLLRTLSADEQAARASNDATATRTAIAQASADAARAEVRDRLLGEIRFATAATVQAREEQAGIHRDGARRLDAQQMADAAAYLGRGDPGDPLSAVAALLVGRYTAENAPAKAETLRAAVLARRPTDLDETRELAAIYFNGGAGELDNRINRVRRAFEVWHGTAEEDAIDALNNLDAPSTTLLNLGYEFRYRENLQTRIDSEMSGADYKMAMGLARGDRALYARGAIDAADGWFSNDPNRALEAIRSLPAGQAARVIDDPETRRHLTTVLGGARVADRRWVTEDRGERELQLLAAVNAESRTTDDRGAARTPDVARLRGLQARADAIELDRIVRVGTGGGAPSLDALFERIRRSVAADPSTANWSAAEIDDEVRRRTRAMENAYETEFGRELPSTGVSALRTAIGRYQIGTKRELTLDLLDVNRAGERAVRLQRTTEGLYTSDSELISELERTYRDALAEVDRSSALQADVERRAATLLKRDGITARGRVPSPAELEAYRGEARREAARALAVEWMGEVKTVFGDRYARRWGGNAADALRSMVESETQFGAEDEALDRLGRADDPLHRRGGGGALSDAMAVRHGVTGWGMEREPVLGAVSGRTRQQLARISAEYSSLNQGENMLARLQDETGGWTGTTPDTRLERDAFDVKEALRGVPTTPREELEAARRRFEYERDVYFRDNPRERELAVGDELASMTAHFARVEAQYRGYAAAEARGDTRSMREWAAGVRMARDAVGVTADNYRKEVDAYVDRAAQIAAITAAIVVAVAVTVLSGGTAGPLVVGLAASLAGTAASMATKAELLGAAYGQTALRTDLLVGIVDAVVTVLTARLGNILLRLPRPQGATAAALRASTRAIEAQRLARPLLHRAAALAVEQTAQSVPSAVTGALLSRDTWRGDPLRNVMTSAGLAAAVGVGVGTAVHGVTTYGPRMVGTAVDSVRMLRGGSGAAMSAESVVLRSAERELVGGGLGHGAAVNRGSALERTLARREYLRRFPGATEVDFARALAGGAEEVRVSAAARAALDAEMKGHLLSGVTGPQRELVAQTRIVLLPEAEFTARTGSQARGNAATLVLNGDPVVVVREGTPLSRLREEGLHVLQFFDPAHVERLRLLDESRMARWGSLPVEERIASWRAKCDLELDVQRRLLTQLDAELADTRPSGRALDLLVHREEVEHALEVLGQRRRQLGAIGTDDVARMRAGVERPPGFLADEPRLFAKSGAPPPAPDVLDVPTSKLEPLEGGRLREVGQDFAANGKRYRFVRILDANGEILDTLIERNTGAGWRRSGRGNRPRGGIAEIAERIERASTLGRQGEVTRVAVEAQREGSGTGFDNVVLSFRRAPDGTVEASVLVVEVKSYFEATVTSFGAISSNFDKNLALVRQRLQSHLDDGTWAAAGMTEAQARAALATVDRRRIDVQIRVTDTTAVTGSSLDTIRSTVNKRPGSDVRVSLDPTPIRPASLAAAERYWDTLEAYRLLGDHHPDSALFRSLANGPQGMSPESIQIADAVVAGRNARPPLVAGHVRWAPGRGHLVDANGPFVVVAPSAGAARTRGGVVGLAGDVVEQARRTASDPTGTKSLRVLLDDLNLTTAEQQELVAMIRVLARDDRTLLGRITSMETGRSIVPP